MVEQLEDVRQIHTRNSAIDHEKGSIEFLLAIFCRSHEPNLPISAF
jgi:hypothetical protein